MTESNDRLTLISEKRLRELLKLEKELLAAREVIKTVDWMRTCPESYHGEDCEYWDHEEEKPSGSDCECGFIESRNALEKYDAATQGVDGELG